MTDIHSLGIYDTILIISLSVAIILNSYVLFRKYFALFKARKGQLPQRLIEFPYFSASPSKYKELLLHQSYLVDSILEDNETTARVNSDILNEMSHKGISKSKYASNIHKYYDISEEVIIEYTLEWPVPYSDSCRYFYRKISFFEENSKWYEKSHYYSSGGLLFTSAWEDVQIISIKKSSLLLTMLGFIDSIFYLERKYPSEYKRYTLFVNKINSIEIKSGYLILKA